MVQLIQSLLPILRRTRDVIVISPQRILSGATDFIRGNPLVSTVSVGLASGFVGAVVAKRRARRKAKSTRKRTTRRKTATRKGRKGTKFRFRTPPSKSKIRFTKKGQPFIILRSGKARFIKKTRARLAKRRKGGFS